MGNSTQPEIAAADEQAIRDLVSRAHDAQNDAHILPTLHSDGVAIVNLVGRRLLGRTAFQEAMDGALASPLKDVTTTVDIVDIRLVAPDTAIVSCVKFVYDGRSASEASDLPSSTGALTYVVVRSDDSWEIALAQTTPILA